MRLATVQLVIVLYLIRNTYGKTKDIKRTRRSPSGFQLAYLQRDFEYDEGFPEETHSGQNGASNSDVRRDEVVSDAKCLQRCNNRLNIGMDMVNAHMSFGSIDVPSVVDSNDLDLFCQLDGQHSQCIDECGYSVQFNLREYVCKQRIKEMKHHLSCYSKSSSIITRHCRPRCGGYHSLEHSLVGYSSRCRQLLCDHTCIDFLLQRICGNEEGKSASAFLLDFTRIQVEYWIREFSRQHSVDLQHVYPSSCMRIQCEGFDSKNCTKTF